MISIDGVDMTGQPPAKRGLSMVFQSYALYPHMSVYGNIAFPLKMAGDSRENIERKVTDAARVLNLTDYLDRKPRQLSGGQRQRVAIGRAIVREPKAFLFDEPLSNLDAALRVNMRLEISELHQHLGTTMIYVTHDQVEAMTMADRIVVLNAGRVEQVGSPLDLYRTPEEPFRRRLHRLAAHELRQWRGSHQAGRRDARHPARASRPLDRSAARGRARSASPSIWAPTPSCMCAPTISARLPPAPMASSGCATARPSI